MERRRPREPWEDETRGLFDLLAEYADREDETSHPETPKAKRARQDLENNEQGDTEQLETSKNIPSKSSAEHKAEKSPQRTLESSLISEAERLERLTLQRRAELLDKLSETFPETVRREIVATIDAFQDWELEVERGRYIYTHLRLRKQRKDGSLVLRFQLRRDRPVPAPAELEQALDEALEASESTSKVRLTPPESSQRILDQYDVVILERPVQETATVMTQDGVVTITTAPELEVDVSEQREQSSKESDSLHPAEVRGLSDMPRELGQKELMERAQRDGTLPTIPEIDALFRELSDEVIPESETPGDTLDDWRDLDPEIDISPTDNRDNESLPRDAAPPSTSASEQLTNLAETLAEATEELVEIPPMQGGAASEERRPRRPQPEVVPKPQPLRQEPPRRESSRRPELGIYQRNERYLKIEKPPTVSMRRKARKLVRILARRYGLMLTPELAAYLLEIILRPQERGGQRVWGLNLNRDELIRTLTTLWLQYGDTYGRRPMT